MSPGIIRGYHNATCVFVFYVREFWYAPVFLLVHTTEVTALCCDTFDTSVKGGEQESSAGMKTDTDTCEAGVLIYPPTVRAEDSWPLS